MRRQFLIFKTSLKHRNISLLSNSVRKYSDKKRQNKIFLTDKYNSFSFDHLNTLSKKLSNNLLASLSTNDLKGAKIGVYCSSNYTYLISLIAIWNANGVPLCLSKLYPANYLDYFLNDSQCKLVINGFGSEEIGSLSIKNKNTYEYKLNENTFFEQTEGVLEGHLKYIEFFW